MRVSFVYRFTSYASGWPARPSLLEKKLLFSKVEKPKKNPGSRFSRSVLQTKCVSQRFLRNGGDLLHGAPSVIRSDRRFRFVFVFVFCLYAQNIILETDRVL